MYFLNLFDWLRLLKASLHQKISAVCYSNYTVSKVAIPMHSAYMYSVTFLLYSANFLTAAFCFLLDLYALGEAAGSPAVEVVTCMHKCVSYVTTAEMIINFQK